MELHAITRLKADEHIGRRWTRFTSKGLRYIVFLLPVAVLSVDLLFRLLLALFAFTFTDIEDFTPLFSLGLGLWLVFPLYSTRNEKATPVLLASMVLLGLWPILANIPLCFIAREFQAVEGAWPQMMINDPKAYLGHVSPRFDALWELSNYFVAFSAIWMIDFFVLFAVVRPRFSVRQRRMILGLTWACMLVAIADPGGLYCWWLD